MMTHQYWFCNSLQNTAGILGYIFNFVSNISSPYVWRKLDNTICGCKGTPHLQGKVIYFASCYLHKSGFYLTWSLDKGSMMYMCVCVIYCMNYLFYVSAKHMQNLFHHTDEGPVFSKQLLVRDENKLSVGSSHAIVRADPNFSLCCYGNKHQKSVFEYSHWEKGGRATHSTVQQKTLNILLY